MNVKSKVYHFITAIFSCVFGFSLNVIVFLSVSYKELGKSTTVLTIAFLALDIIWVILLNKTKYRAVSVAIMAVFFMGTLDIFRKKYLTVGLFLGDKYDEAFDFFLNVNPVYYSGMIYIGMAMLIFAELMVIHIIRINKNKKENEKC